MTLFNNFFSSTSVFDVRPRQYHNAKTDMEEKKLLNKVIFVFFKHKQVFT